MGGYSVNQELLKFLRDGFVIMPDVLITFDGYNDVGFQTTALGYPMIHRYQDKFFSFVEQNHPMAPDTLDMRNPDKIVHGIRNERILDSDNWINAVRKIYSMATEFGIKYYSFFQPMILSGKAIVDESVISLRDEYFRNEVRVKEIYERIPIFVSECRKKMSQYSYITDLTKIFDGEEDVYYDICHATEKGNTIIMEYIFKIIERETRRFSE